MAISIKGAIELVLRKELELVVYLSLVSLLIIRLDSFDFQ